MGEWVPMLRDGGPRFVALADAVVSDVRAGRLLPGARLPGTRTLAERIGVHRNTVVRAYAELQAQGWVTSVVGSGTVVAEVPVHMGPPQAVPARVGFPLPPPRVRHVELEAPLRYRFVGGQPDLRLLPLAELARAYRRALRAHGRVLVDYGDPAGLPVLRRALRAWLAARRSLSVPEDGLVVTRGAQQGLYLVAHGVFRPGDRIGVEAYGFRPAWDALRTAGLELVPVPVDRDGMDVDVLVGRTDLAGVYVTPHHQFPTGGMLTASRRERLLGLARDRRWCVIEDDYDHEFHWQGHPVAPLAARDTHGVVVSVGTLSKAFAPGIRVGWVVAAPPVVARLVDLRRVIDRQGDLVVERAVADLIEDGELDRHVRRVLRLTRERREALLQAIAEDLPDLGVAPPPGGLALWCEAPGVDVRAWSRAAASEGVRMDVGGDFTLDGSQPAAVRLGFPALTPDEIRDGVRILARTLAVLRAPDVRGARFSRRLPSESSTVFEVHGSDGRFVVKTSRSARAFAQEGDALAVLHPERVLHADPRALRRVLAWLPGASSSLEPAAHQAAGRWLRGLHDRPCPDEDPVPLGDAWSRRIAALRERLVSDGRTSALRALDGVDPARLVGPRVLCHRDFRPANWLWTGHVLHIVDFEHSRPDHPLWDLVKLASEVWPSRPDLRDAFRAGYGPVDEGVLADLITIFALQTDAWFTPTRGGLRTARP